MASPVLMYEVFYGADCFKFEHDRLAQVQVNALADRFWRDRASYGIKEDEVFGQTYAKALVDGKNPSLRMYVLVPQNDDGDATLQSVLATFEQFMGTHLKCEIDASLRMIDGEYSQSNIAELSS